MIRIAARILIRFLVLPVSCFLILVTGYLLLVNGYAYAAENLHPAPAPCTNAETTSWLTENFVTNDEGEAPFNFTTEQTGTPGQSFSVDVSTSFQIDFSKLQAIFGPSNSDYQDGKTQDTQRQSADLINLKDQDLNQFNGPIQKISPASLLDSQKVKFVEYVAANPHLLESDDKYTDKEGQSPKTVYELVQAFGFPQPPKASEDKSDWNEKWGKYWAKIPTAYREFYKGFLEFRAYGGEKTFKQLKDGSPDGFCPTPQVLRELQFVMPEFKRTVGTSDQLNNIIVPCAAQSLRHGEGINGDECGNTPKTAQNLNNVDENGNILSKALKFCKQLITSVPKGVAEKFKKTVKVSLKILDPVKNAQAAEPTPTPIPCFKIMSDGKEGNAPFCAVAQDQLVPGDVCSNPNPQDPNNLNKGQNVLCTLVVSGQVTLYIPTDLSEENPLLTQWNSCRDNGDGTYTCSSTIRVFPVFQIPFLAEIWNSTYYSDENEQPGVASDQKTGRPGIYTNFMPQAISQVLFEGDGLITRDRYEELSRRCQGGGAASGDELVDNPACVELAEALEALEAAYPEITAQQGGCDYSTPIQLKQCFGPYWSRITSRSLPGQVADNVAGAKDSNVLGVNSGDQKERFIGATDCSKSFTKDIALKPKALQEHIGISEQDCNMEAASNTGTQPGGDDGGGPPGGGDDGSTSTLDYYIKYGDTSIKPSITKEFADSLFPDSNVLKICPGGITCWDYVIQRSISRGISPAFAISIWWEEGGFGGSLSGGGRAKSEFGCFSGGNISLNMSFSEAFNCFLNFTGTEHPYNASDPQGSFTEWAKWFCGPGAVPVCSNNPNFLKNLKSVYNTVAPGEIVLINGTN